MPFPTISTPTRLFAAAAALFLIAGCSKEASHATLHNIAKQQCRHIINPEERQACMEQHSKSYREYEAQNYSRETEE